MSNRDGSEDTKSSAADSLLFRGWLGRGWFSLCAFLGQNQFVHRMLPTDRPASFLSGLLLSELNFMAIVAFEKKP